MTYIILQTVYCITFSVACFLILKKIYTKKLKELEEIYQKGILACESLEDKNHELYIKKINQAYQKNIDNIKDLNTEHNKALIAVKHEASRENKLYLSRMNIDISSKIKELADTIKNKPIIL